MQLVLKHLMFYTKKKTVTLGRMAETTVKAIMFQTVRPTLVENKQFHG